MAQMDKSLRKLVYWSGYKRQIKRQRALLLHYAGEDVNEIFDTLEGTGEDFATAKQKLKDYFAPKKNTQSMKCTNLGKPNSQQMSQ